MEPEMSNKKEGNRRRGAAMKKVKEREELEQLYNNLQQEWDAYKQSNPRTSRSRRYSHSLDHPNTIKANQLLHISPRFLMAALQQQSSTTIDLAAQEIIQERREATERSMFKCRRLFHSTDTGSEEAFFNDVMGQDKEVRSLSFCSSEDDEHGINPYYTHSSYSSSSPSSPCLSHDSVAKDKEDMVAVVAEERVAANGYAIRPGIENGARYIVLGGIAIVLLVFAVCMKSATSFGGYQVILVPT